MPQPISSKQQHAIFRKKTPAENSASLANPKSAKQKRRRHLKQYIHWLWPYRYALGGVFLLAIITAAMDMLWPLAIKFIIDRIIIQYPDAGTPSLFHAPSPAIPINFHPETHTRMWWLAVTGAGIILLLLIKQTIDSTRHYRMVVLDSRVTLSLRRRLFQRLLGLPLRDLSEMKAGGIVSRLSSDADAVGGLVQMALISPGVAIIRVILTVGILLLLSWQLAIAAMVMIPPLALLSLLWLRKIRPIYRSAQDDRMNLDGRISETFGGIRVVRAFRREPREERNHALGRHLITRKWLYASRLEIILESGWGLLIPSTSLLIVWYGGYLVLSGQAKIGDIFAFQIYAVLLLQPVWEIVRSISQTQKSMAAMDRVFEALEIPLDKPDPPNAIEPPQPVREIRFDNVTFEYRPGLPVVRDFSLTVPGGTMVALVGPSGAGKTTITDLVARFYDPTAGAILLNGVDLRQIHLHSYRRLLAIVQQDVFLFDGTLRDNIAYGLRGATESMILDAAKRANAHSFIAQLPEAYDTPIGERGFKLSGGQKQRISIARAILADPQILILDEATSNLDTESEQLIQASLSELFKGRTTFVIAHRLSTVTHADTIVVLDNGQLREVGTHSQLMNRQDFYYEMVERQRQPFQSTGRLI